MFSRPNESPLNRLRHEAWKRAVAAPAAVTGVRVEPLEPRRLFAAGDVDPTFSGDGQLTTAAFGAHARAWDVAVQVDGKIVVAGAASSPSGNTSDAVLLRYNADGALDSSFGNGGVARLDFGGNEHFRELRILEDGSIVVGGTAQETLSQWVIARYTAGGTLHANSGFGGTDGISTGSGTLEGLTLDRAGRIVTFGGDVVRRHSGSTGALDATFGPSGTGIVTNVGNILALDVDNANGVLLSGTEDYEDPSHPGVDFAYATAARLTASGALDTSFGDGGFVRLGGSDVHKGVDILSNDGYVYLLSNSSESGSKLYQLSEGQLIGSGVRVGYLDEISASQDDVPMELIGGTVGNIYVVGYADTDFSGTQVGVQRLLDSGDIDTRFGTDGTSLFPLYGADPSTIVNAGEMAIAFAPGNRLVVAGNAFADFPERRIAVARIDDLNAEPAATAPHIAIEGGILIARGTIFNDTFFLRRSGADNVSIELRYGDSQTTTATFDMDDFTGVRIEGLAGSDTFNMVDALVSPAVRNTTILGGSGHDVIDYSSRTSPITFNGYILDDAVLPFPYVNITSGAATDRVDHTVEHFIGGSGADVFSVDNGSFIDEEDFILPDVTLEGRDGNDTFHSATIMHATMYGGAGNDVFFNDEDGFELIYAGDGDDRIVASGEGMPGIRDAGAGIDTLDVAGIFHDVIDMRLYPGLENLEGAGAWDARLVIGNDLNNRITATTDDPDESITLRGMGGDDTLIGSSADDVLEGGDGNDSLDGGDGTDTLVGGPGSDTLLNGEVNDQDGLPGVSLNGGILSFTGTNADEQISIWLDGANLVVWLDGATANYDPAAVTRIELNGNGGNDLLKLHKNLAIPAALNGGDGDDKLIGGASNDTLLGGDGNDHLTGNSGDDLLDGGLGSDAMIGSGGKDTVDYSSRTANLVIGLDGLMDDGEAGENDLVYFDIERVLGGLGNDRIGGSAGDNQLYGGPGNDTIGGGDGDDSLYGGGGNDKVHGDDGDDYVEAGAGHDAVHGGGGADLLLGLAGNDRLFSGDDGLKDFVIGGIGTDSADADELDEVSSVEIFV